MESITNYNARIVYIPVPSFLLSIQTCKTEAIHTVPHSAACKRTPCHCLLRLIQGELQQQQAQQGIQDIFGEGTSVCPFGRDKPGPCDLVRPLIVVVAHYDANRIHKWVHN